MAIEVGSGDEYDMGPQVSADELESTLEYIDIAGKEGATLAAGGEALDGGRFGDGYFVAPTVFSDVGMDHRLALEEVFGPVLAVLKVDGFTEAIEVANNVNYGLSASIITHDHTEANRFVEDIEAGVAKINEKTTGLELHVPFGGFKDSSSETWREQGDAGLDFYTIEKTVYENFKIIGTRTREPTIRWYPGSSAADRRSRPAASRYPRVPRRDFAVPRSG
jgi:aldehyde dehydrogenase (NAD+)